MYKFISLRSAMIFTPTVSALVLCAALLPASEAMAQSTPATNAPAKETKAVPTKATQAETPKDDKTSNPQETQDAKEQVSQDAQPAAPTPEQREEARLAYTAGTEAFAEGDFVTAHAEFLKAYNIIPSPHAEYWIASSLDKSDPEMENARATATAYETFLGNPGASYVGQAEVDQATERLKEIRKVLPANVTIVTVPEGASVTLNGETKDGKTPLTVELPAGTYQVELSLDGYDDATVEVVAEGGIVLEQQITLAKTIAPSPPPPVVTAPVDAAPKRSMVPAIVTLGLGGAGLISGTVFGIMALSAKSKFNDDPTASRADAAERNALIADMSFGLALTLGITGIVLLTSQDEAAADNTAKKTKHPKTEFSFAPYASPRGGGAAARLRF